MGLIERKYVDVRESVKLRLQQETACVSITGDIWTSIATHAYLTLTVHFLSSEWESAAVCAISFENQFYASKKTWDRGRWVGIVMTCHAHGSCLGWM